MLPNDFPVIDLFAGAGGFGEAAKLAGASLSLSIEVDETCCRTLESNNGSGAHRVEQADVRLLRGKDLRRLAGLRASDPLIIVGGPPCQPFSKASYWTDPGDDARYRRARARGSEGSRPRPITDARPDERRDLLGDFLRLVVEAKADGFVMENVSSLLHPRNRDMFWGLVREFEACGYQVTTYHANGANHGVPQKRKRIFVMGSKRAQPTAPTMTHRVAAKDPEALPQAAAVGPFLEPYSGAEFAEAGEEVEGRWAECLREVPPGANYKHLTEWAGHPNPVFEAETRFWNFLLKLDPELPSWTINANPGPWVGPFHWSSRRLRTPELAAIQTFPAGYKFHGGRRERVRQIGNAVPAIFAAPMIESVIATLAAGS
ncbi:MAG: DNA cytosine methyltransferase [Dehalococcoidia bacterium]